MGLAAAVVVSDPASNRKIKKPKEYGPKVDAVIALIMGVYPCVYSEEGLGDDLGFWVA